MEVKFVKKPLQCLRPIYNQVQTQEQTQEVRLPDAYPDIGKVLGCWGQVLVRGKEWRSTAMGVNGGVMAWVMYAPEDGTQNRVVDVWIPFQCRWDFPEASDDGNILVQSVLTNLDGRSISARKIMVRAGIDTYAQAMEQKKFEIAEPPELPEDVQLLRRSYPVDLPVEAGEKQVQLEETLTLPENQPAIEKIVHYKLAPSIAENKVLGNRLVFRGNATLHLMYLTEDGSVHHWDWEIPFSQYTELDRDYGPNAVAWVIPVLTASELEMDENKLLQMRGGIAAQYTIFDRNMLEMIEDAFSPRRMVTAQTESLQLPVLLDSTAMELQAESQLNGEVDRIWGTTPFAEYPVLRMGQNGLEIGMDGYFQTLYQDGEGQMMTDNNRFAVNMPFLTAPENQAQLWPGNPSQPETMTNGEGMTLRSRYPVTVQMYSGQPIPMITELELGEMQDTDPNRPSIILRRADRDSLWELAKQYGSTVAAIQETNQLTQEPEMGKLLLIPIQ